MPPFRYLLHFSYIGTKYSGVAEQANQPQVKTVFSEIIKSLKNLERKPSLLTSLYISSRTDAGVHALHNTAHIDLDFDADKKSYKFPFDKQADQNFCDQIKNDLNKIFVKNDEAIRILKIQKVMPTFSARNRAQARTYLYRLSLLNEESLLCNQKQKLVGVSRRKKKVQDENISGSSNMKYLSPFETEYITPISLPFDLNLFKKAIDICSGQHNFSAFTTDLGRKDIIKSNRLPVKTLKFDLNVNENGQFLKDYLQPIHNKYSIIELQITGESFLYKMIRKLVGAMVDVAKNRITLQMLEKMMLCPPDYYDFNNINILGPSGLILKRVYYNDSDLEYNEKDYELYLKENVKFNKNNN